MTGRIHYTPEARQQLHQLDEWISEKAAPETARKFVAAILDYIDGTWQEDRRRPSAMNDDNHVPAGQPHSQ